jgi:cellulose synthase/poly-beta-1,6-N-acetylglucosamine synthase-like glycosyltransferase
MILHATSAIGTSINHHFVRISQDGAPDWVYSIFFAVFCFYVIAIVFPFLLFLGWRLLSPRKRLSTGGTPMVSVIIPAYNEQDAIGRSIRGALDQDYPNFEVIIVDDGSRDFTPYLAEDQRITFLRLNRNRGKAAALNAAIARSKGDIIVFSDADSVLDSQAVRHLVKCFVHPAVGAVAGKVEVKHLGSYLVRWQVLEYVLGQEVVKCAQIASGTSATVCPGPVSAFRRDILHRIGGYKDRTLVEDFDITLELIAHGYHVAYEPKALAWTQTPVTWETLRKQRLRWYRGNLQVFSTHRGLFLNARAGLVGLFWLPYSLLVGFGGVLLESLLLLSFPFVFWLSGLPITAFAPGLVFMLIIELLGAMQYLTSMGLAGRWDSRLISASFLAKPYHLFLAWVRLAAIWKEIKQREHTWNG